MAFDNLFMFVIKENTVVITTQNVAFDNYSVEHYSTLPVVITTQNVAFDNAGQKIKSAVPVVITTQNVAFDNSDTFSIHSSDSCNNHSKRGLRQPISGNTF